MTHSFLSKQASNKSKFKSSLALAAAISAGLSQSAHALPSYTLTQLNALETGVNGLSQSYASGINANGQVVGHVFAPFSHSRAVLWDTGSNTPINLGTLGGNSSHATAINDNGVIVGDSYITGNTQVKATIWQAGITAPTALGDLGSHAYAKDINNAGQAVGMAYINNRYDAVYWQNESVAPINLTPFGANSDSANAINDSGQLAGTIYVGGVFEAAFWQSSTNNPNLLGTLGGNNGSVEGINDNGKVVGHSNKPSENIHAFSWQVGDSSLTDLGTLFGAGSSYANDINTGGQIVGSSAGDVAGGPQHATLWQSGATSPIDLNTLVAMPFGYLYEAVGINDAGQIIANATNGRAFLLTPTVASIPLPAPIWLFGSAIIGIFGLRRSKP